MTQANLDALIGHPYLRRQLACPAQWRCRTGIHLRFGRGREDSLLARIESAAMLQDEPAQLLLQGPRHISRLSELDISTTDAHRIIPSLLLCVDDAESIVRMRP